MLLSVEPARAQMGAQMTIATEGLEPRLTTTSPLPGAVRDVRVRIRNAGNGGRRRVAPLEAALTENDGIPTGDYTLELSTVTEGGVPRLV